MPYTPVAGKSGSFHVGSASFAFDKWESNDKVGLPEVTNFNSGGYRDFVVGIIQGEITASGAYDENNMTLTLGQVGTVTCSVDGTISLTATAAVENIKLTDDVKDAVRVAVTFQKKGAFTASIS